MTQKVIFSGGGSGGHVMPALTLIKELQKLEVELAYIGGQKGIEKELVAKTSISYHPILTGKLRRYFSWENFKDLFKIIAGIFQALVILIKESKKTLVFSTGGFVAVPVVIAARLTGKKVFIHEQTAQAGLANRLSALFAHKVFVSFEQSVAFFPKNKTLVSGYPLRDECYSSRISPVRLGDEIIDPKNLSRPLLLVTGGGNGSFLLNTIIKNNLLWLKSRYFVVHQVGAPFIEEFKKLNDDSYLALDFINEGMIDLYKMASIVISRSGAGTVSELLALGKKSIFIPLKIAQKNEQYYNAMEAQKKLGSLILLEDELEQVNWRQLFEKFQQGAKIIPAHGELRAKDFLIKNIREAINE